ncbi:MULTISPECIES: LmeA family phospholipid-binding protein [Corynebacterium]|uniref:LmeA family phospholipid-binding protein n=1 Tax=Corynebacterium TaxID=1716 RepID=UPI00124EB51E|nr:MULTISPECIES: DUF2993 domain-containing protein [Corynebacterium]
MSASHGSSKSPMKIVVGLLLALLVIAVVAEVGTRFYVGKRITEEVPSSSVSFGASPLLLGAATGTVNHLTVDTENTLEIVSTEAHPTEPSVTGTPKATVDIDKLDIRGERLMAGHFAADAILPDEYLLAMAQRTKAERSDGNFFASLIEVTDIDTAGQKVRVLINDGLATLTLTPRVGSNQLEFQVDSIEVGTVRLPDAFSEEIGRALQVAVAEATVDLTITEVEVVDTGLRVVAVGDNVDLNSLQEQL